MHYNNPINIADLNESERMAQCCYSENTGRVQQTGCERETNRENGEREKADGTITKLEEEEADRKTGEGGGGGEGHCEWMGVNREWLQVNMAFNGMLTSLLKQSWYEKYKQLTGLMTSSSAITELRRACCYLYLYDDAIFWTEQKVTETWWCWRFSQFSFFVHEVNYLIAICTGQHKCNLIGKCVRGSVYLKKAMMVDHPILVVQ